jgi:CRISPR/Cas system-associated exonuclease Cas4 (RecB family)
MKQSIILASDKWQLTTDEAEKLGSYYEQMSHFVAFIKQFRLKYGVRPQNVYLEYKIGISRDFRITKFYDNTGLFRGALDLTLITNRGDAIVIDHKSGKQKELSAYEDQCKAYCILALAFRPELRGVQTAINFVQTDQLAWNPHVTADTIRKEYHPWLLDYLDKATVGLQSPPTPQEGWWCGWCEYKPICPNFPKKP